MPRVEYANPEDMLVVCPRCTGTGEIPAGPRSGPGPRLCPLCKGSGRVTARAAAGHRAREASRATRP